MRRELEVLSALRRELGRALQSFSRPVSTTMQLFSDAKAEGSSEPPGATDEVRTHEADERFREMAESCDATLRELRRMTEVVESMRDALARRSRGERLSLSEIRRSHERHSVS